MMESEFEPREIPELIDRPRPVLDTVEQVWQNSAMLKWLRDRFPIMNTSILDGRIMEMFENSKRFVYGDVGPGGEILVGRFKVITTIRDTLRTIVDWFAEFLPGDRIANLIEAFRVIRDEWIGNLVNAYDGLMATMVGWFADILARAQAAMATFFENLDGFGAKTDLPIAQSTGAVDNSPSKTDTEYWNIKRADDNIYKTGFGGAVNVTGLTDINPEQVQDVDLLKNYENQGLDLFVLPQGIVTTFKRPSLSRHIANHMQGYDSIRDYEQDYYANPPTVDWTWLNYWNQYDNKGYRRFNPVIEDAKSSKHQHDWVLNQRQGLVIGDESHRWWNGTYTYTMNSFENEVFGAFRDLPDPEPLDPDSPDYLPWAPEHRPTQEELYNYLLELGTDGW